MIVRRGLRPEAVDDRLVILLDNVVQILVLANLDRRFPLRVKSAQHSDRCAACASSTERGPDDSRLLRFLVVPGRRPNVSG
jgi:hypothetical protein